MDRSLLGGALLAVLLVLAGCSTAPGAETATDIDSRTLWVLVENRDDGDQREVFLSLGLREGEEVIWDDNESLSGIEYREQSIVINRDGQFDLAVSVGDRRREYVWNSTECADFRLRVPVERGGDVSHGRFRGEGWLREF